MMLSNSPGWKQVSPLEHLIARACDVTLPEPNYAVNLEVADYINQKKANTPREAAMLIAHLANNRNPHIAMLALTLLDTLVQSCGYPFHLQMSTKEFLNELVRRFPERPPPFPNPVMTRILELIHGWKEGICTQSRWKDDLGNIRDMHRLLTFKGYRFRDLSRQHQDTLASASNIKTAEELENEDREAQSAKLQELIRRGTPRDLAAAQELMKSLAGANPDAKPDYRAQALTDLNKLESKVILLNEMLDNVDTEREEKFVPGDAYDQVATILGAARPKLQKWISDAESYDSESLDTFLQINDQINNVLNRYEAFKKGDYETARNPVPAELSNQSTSGQSLIDFDDDTGMQSQAGNGAGQDDLAGLFGPSTQTSQAVMSPSQNTNTLIGGMGTGGMNMAFSNQGVPTTHSPSPVMGGMGGMNNPMFRNTSMSPPAIMLPSTPANGSPARNGTPGTPGMAPQGGMAMNMGMNSPAMGAGMGMGFGGMGAGMVSGMGMGMGMSGPSQPQQQSFFPTQQPTQLHQQQQQNSPSNSSTAPSQASGKDPFADLAGLF
ncbi:vhs domain-containing protein [Moniliophthora roreri MCA 2997]|uniref:Vhs domain-containing protein n=1 Tax=Moniliophthora roreri (strain MCA 2997) TaxID=1381753 RepID=V2XGF1_MONRO|nr:vhs domain-containing protein [Moniliophthora roreri MCA 2997]